VSIDDSEQSQLKFALDSTFGEDNFVAMVIWQKVFAPKNTAKYFSEDHDYVAVCAKDKAMWYPMLLPRTEEADARYSNPDNDPRDVWSSSDLTARNYYSEGQYEVVAPCGKTFRPALGTYWRVKKSKFEDLDRDKRIWWGEDGCNMPRLKRFLNEVKPGIVPQTLWKHEDVGNTQEAKKELLATVKFTRTEEVLNTVKPTRLIRQILRIGTDVEASAIALDFFAGSGTTGHAVINQNRADNGDRRYILVEMGSHFDTMLKPRLQRVIYANDWKDALPVPGSPGQSHMFHYICPESYEDTLNNLRFRELEGPLLDRLHDMPDYFLHYMLEFETQGSPSLLDARRFERPFDYRLNITRGGVTAPQAVDLVTTFNFLLGLRVRTIRRFERDGAPVVRVTGEDGTGRRVCVLWRDAPPPEAMEAEKDWLQAHVLGDVPCDLLYVNGESALLGALPVEPEFHRLMFEGVS
jgi:adenine-specific DNA-methyltransferase